MGNAANVHESYDSFYDQFDSPVMRQLRQEAYRDEIGQHSWVRADDLRRDVSRLRISASSNLLDLGCGPCGPLVFLVDTVRCHSVGVELSAAALEAGRTRVAAHRFTELIELRQVDLNQPLPFADASFAAAVSFDVIPHLADREATFREVARVLISGGRFLFTDATVVTGAISGEQLALRGFHGFTQFASHEFNQRTLEQTGFKLLETEDRTASVVQNASGRLRARLAHREELVQVEGVEKFARWQRYLETAARLATSKSLSRVMYLAEHVYTAKRGTLDDSLSSSPLPGGTTTARAPGRMR